ncbi:MAG: OmpH family outer membrane protein [Verrucomicrobiota bacterium]
MKKLQLTILTFTLLAAMAFSANAQTKTASVDMKKLFEGYWKTKQAQTALENRKVELRKEIKDMTDNLEKSQAEYKQLLDQAMDQAISADEREKRKHSAGDKAKEMSNSKIALEQFQRQAEAQLADQSQRMSGNIVTEIRKAVADKAKAGGYTTVLNANTTEIVVYVEPGIDITESVLKQLNAGAPIDVTKPAAGLPLNISTKAP